VKQVWKFSISGELFIGHNLPFATKKTVKVTFQVHALSGKFCKFVPVWEERLSIVALAILALNLDAGS
jgi:hypothetical protein